MADVVPAAAGTIIISIDYDPSGLARATLFDNECLAWHLNGPGAPPIPSIIGYLPPLAPVTPPVQSPQWARLMSAMIDVPGHDWRGSIHDFFTWLATNNGVVRQLEKRLGANPDLFNAFDHWARANPSLVYSG